MMKNMKIPKAQPLKNICQTSRSLSIEQNLSLFTHFHHHPPHRLSSKGNNNNKYNKKDST
uniref:Uncharacterized protein n=1 Tax=Tetranychus urticae TaxID=32264 RepID=T1KWF2_TETUR